MNWLSDIALAGAAQSLLLAMVLLVIRNTNLKANAFLSAFLLMQSFKLLGVAYFYRDLPLPPLLFYIKILSLFDGALLFLYVRALCDAQLNLARSLSRHIIPLLLLVVTVVVSTHSVTSGLDRNNLQAVMAPLRDLSQWVAVFTAGLTLFYLGCARQHLQQYRHKIEQSYSSLDKISLVWLDVLLLVGMGLWLFGMLLYVFWQDGDRGLFYRDSLTIVVLLTYVYLIALGGLRQPDIFRLLKTDDQTPAADTATTLADTEISADTVTAQEKYQKAGVDDSQAEKIWAALQELMQRDHPYLNQDLTLADLSELLGFSTNTVSQVINSHSDGSFYQFVNHYRVEEAKRILTTDFITGSLLDVSERAGFKSQSTFYQHFKQRTGQPPKAWLKAQ